MFKFKKKCTLMASQCWTCLCGVPVSNFEPCLRFLQYVARTYAVRGYSTVVRLIFYNQWIQHGGRASSLSGSENRAIDRSAV
jgi:hypothetical protein